MDRTAAQSGASPENGRKREAAHRYQPWGNQPCNGGNLENPGQSRPMNLPPLFRFLLWPFSMLYAAAMMVRAQLYKAGWLKQRHLSGKVISIGNLTVGGTGK